MSETLVEKVVWRRSGVLRNFVGSLRVGDAGIRLSGRDPASGVEVALSIPPGEVSNVRVSATGEEVEGQQCIVLELVESEAIFLREVGVGPLNVQLLARRLAALTHASPAIAQGG